VSSKCNLYLITTNQAAIVALFRVRYVGNLPPMPGVFPNYPAPAVRNTDMPAGASSWAHRLTGVLFVDANDFPVSLAAKLDFAGPSVETLDAYRR
jgi:hypothetical protein